MKRFLVQNAIPLLALAVVGAVITTPARADMPDKVVVVHIKAIDGLDAAPDQVRVERNEEFRAGSRYHIARSSVSSLDGIRVLVLMDRRTDSMEGGTLVQKFTLNTMAQHGTSFSVDTFDGKKAAYSVDVLSDGSVDLLGPKDRIVVRNGGHYTIWKIEDASLVRRDNIDLY